MAETLLVMTERRFGAVGVVDAEGRLAGVITDGDLRRKIDGLMSHTAAEVMSRAPTTVPPHRPGWRGAEPDAGPLHRPFRCGG